MQKARIKLASAQIDKINKTCNHINQIAEKTGVALRGPIPLPTKRMKVAVRRTPCGEGYASWERFEMRVHKRLIDLQVDDRALRLVMKVPIPEGLNIEIEILEN